MAAATCCPLGRAKENPLKLHVFFPAEVQMPFSSGALFSFLLCGDSTLPLPTLLLLNILDSFGE